MTMDEIIRSDKEVLIPTDIAPILHCTPYTINILAHKDPSSLGFPVMRIGNRVKIPRRAFINYMCGKTDVEAQNA